jgi:hypothetical protein
MPAVSKKQERFMQAVAHNKAFAKKAGVPQSVGREFTKGSEMKGESPIQKKAKAGAKMVKMAGGGMANTGGAMRGLDRAAAMSGRAMPAGRPMGMKKGGGIEVKGKTKGKMITMKGSK